MTADALGEVVLDGFHAVKHAVRFGAAVSAIWVVDRDRALDLCDVLAPDLRPVLAARAEVVDRSAIEAVAPPPHPTGVIGFAHRPASSWSPPPTAGRAGPLLLLDAPRHAGNLGAAVRVAAAGGASGLVTRGGVDPWSRAAVRAAAGLHWAIPVVAHGGALSELGPILAFDAGGDDLRRVDLDPGAVLAFGSERAGLSPEVRRAATRVVAIPMQAGVSSLNLATSVAVALYRWRLGP